MVASLQQDIELQKKSTVKLSQQLPPSCSTQSPQSTDETTLHRTKPKSKNKAKIPQTLRIACWNKYIGEEVGKAPCVCCKNIAVTQHNFHCGHVVAEANGGKLTVDNLRPICSCCNNSMGTMDMREFAEAHFEHTIEAPVQEVVSA